METTGCVLQQRTNQPYIVLYFDFERAKEEEERGGYKRGGNIFIDSDMVFRYSVFAATDAQPISPLLSHFRAPGAKKVF